MISEERAGQGKKGTEAECLKRGREKIEKNRDFRD